MFKIRYLSQDVEAYRPTLSGVTFGFLDKPLYFDVVAETEPELGPLRLEFLVADQKEKPPLTFHVEPFADGRLPVRFFNPAKLGPSGLSQPTGILVLQQRFILGLMFLVEFVGPESKTYRLTYEFSDGLLATPELKP